jgi:hypothetical protein
MAFSPLIRSSDVFIASDGKNGAWAQVEAEAASAPPSYKVVTWTSVEGEVTWQQPFSQPCILYLLLAATFRSTPSLLSYRKEIWLAQPVGHHQHPGREVSFTPEEVVVCGSFCPGPLRGIRFPSFAVRGCGEFIAFHRSITINPLTSQWHTAQMCRVPLHPSPSSVLRARLENNVCPDE